MKLRGGVLSHEDRILWNQVARTATPFKGRSLLPEPEPEPAPPQAEAGPGAREVLLGPQPAPKGQRRDMSRRELLRMLDEPTRDRLAKGRLAIEARVDLHGLNQSEAHALLLSFLHRAHAGGVRHVLVITGKGSSLGSEGVLRKALPHWFATPAFRSLVGGYDAAARQHGGDGAFYVRLRRPSPGHGA